MKRAVFPKLLLADRNYPAEQSPGGAFRPFVCLLTRFAMATPYSAASMLDDTQAIEEWIERRIPIFARYCVPSVAAQTCRPDLWLLGLRDGLDSSAPEIRRAITDLPFVQIATQDRLSGREEGTATSQYLEVAETFSRGIRSEHLAGYSHVLTIRLDNDDFISPYYVSSAVEYMGAVVAKHGDARMVWASFPYGLQVKDDVASVLMYPNGPFQVKLERLPNSKITNIYSSSHTKMFSREHAYPMLTKTPMWVQIVHGDNAMNDVKGPVLKVGTAKDAFRSLWLGSEVPSWVSAIQGPI